MIISAISRKIFACAVLVAAPACFAASNVGAARALFESGHYLEAQSSLSAEESNQPPDPEIYYWLARCDFELREFDSAIFHAERAISLSPNNSEYHHWLGRSYGRKAEHSNWFSGVNFAKKTHSEFQIAVALDPRNIPAQRDLITFQLRAPGFLGGGEDKARAQIEKIAQIDPVQAHLARKDLYAEHKQWDQADQECKAVLAANPKDPDEYSEVAEFYEHRNNPSAIREALEEATRNGASNSRLEYYVGVAAGLAGDHFAEGEGALKKYLSDVPQRSGQPSHSEAHYWLGRIYDKQGHRDLAVNEYRQALDADPSNKAAREALRHGNE